MQPFVRPSTPLRAALPAALDDSPAIEKESHIGSELASRQARQAADDFLRGYENNRDKCVLLPLPKTVQEADHQTRRRH
jgi:hypothetical protein